MIPQDSGEEFFFLDVLISAPLAVSCFPGESKLIEKGDCAHMFVLPFAAYRFVCDPVPESEPASGRASDLSVRLRSQLPFVLLTIFGYCI